MKLVGQEKYGRLERRRGKSQGEFELEGAGEKV